MDELCSQLAVDEVDGHLVAREDAGCLYWVQNLTLTEDDHWLAKGTPPKAPFPKKSYFRYLLGAMMQPVVHPSDHCQQLYCPKSRQLMTSYMACGYIAWLCQWRPGIFWVIQTEKEDKAAELVRYVRILGENQPDWLRAKHPMRSENLLERVWANGSRVLGVPKGQNQIRVHHPFGYLADEAAFLPEFEACVNAVLPVAKQIIAISSANPGPFADMCESSLGMETPRRVETTEARKWPAPQVILNSAITHGGGGPVV